MPGKKNLIAFVLLAISLAFAFPAHAQGQAPALKKVVFAEAARGEGWLPIYLAQALGFFKEEGLDPQFVTYKDGPLALMGLVNGDAQFCIIGFEPVLMAFDKGQQSKVLLSTLSSQPYMFAAREGIDSLADFKGKKVFAGMAGSAPYYFAKTVLRGAGLDPDKDVTFVSLEYGAEIAALGRGDIDGAYVRSTRAALLDQVKAKALVDTTDQEQHARVYGSKRYEAMVVQVTEAFVKKDPQAVQAFCNAVAKAMAWQAAHGDAEVAAAVAPFFPGVNIDAAMIATLRRCLSPDGRFTPEGYQAVVDFCLKNGVIKKPIPMDAVVEKDFMAKASGK